MRPRTRIALPPKAPAAEVARPTGIHTRPLAEQTTAARIAPSRSRSMIGTQRPTVRSRSTSQRSFARRGGIRSRTGASSAQTMLAPLRASRWKKCRSSPSLRNESSNHRSSRAGSAASKRMLFVNAQRRRAPVGSRVRAKKPPCSIHAGGGDSKIGSTGPVTISAECSRFTRSSSSSQPSGASSSSSMKPTRPRAPANSIAAASPRLRGGAMPRFGSSKTSIARPQRCAISSATRRGEESDGSLLTTTATRSGFEPKTRCLARLSRVCASPSAR